MVYYNNTLCVSGSQLIISDKNPNGIISKPLWDKLRRDGVNVVRRSCIGQPALIDFNSLPTKYKNLVSEKFGMPAEIADTKPFRDKVLMDAKASTFFSAFILSNGNPLPDFKQREYTINASVLNAVGEVYTEMKKSRSKFGKSTNGFWAKAILAVNDIRGDFQHTLPSKEVPLKRVYQKYITNGYQSLISGKYCNDNSRKVSDKLENLIMSLYTMPNKPFAAETHHLYIQFLTGKIEVVDQKTGELFNPQDFYENGQPITVSESTVKNYINQPYNRAIVDSVRMGQHRYNTSHRPHHHRHAPQFSFSKISMDDRDLPRKCDNGRWVKSYYAYDVTSGCVVGYAHSNYKNEELFLDCLRNMLQLIELQGWGMPMEVEVENHLVNKFFDDLALMFTFLRICRPGNSQEKRAEHFNRAKKYGEEKRSQNNIGRWWSKHEAYTVDRDRKGDEFVEKVVLPFDRLVADDIQSIFNYNNQPHPKQKKYPGKTRWQVLVENMNPNTPEVSKPVVYKSIGFKTDTSINRSQYATVRGAKYQIPNISVLEKMAYGNTSVQAYWLPEADKTIKQVYLYQGDTFLCKADKLITYNEAKAEQTPEDLVAFKNQSEFVASFDAATKSDKKQLSRAVIIKSDVLNEALNSPVEVAPVIEKQEPTFEELINDQDFDNDDASDSL